MTDVNIAIIGLERLGTSFGLALKRYMAGKDARHKFTISGFDERGYNGKYAKRNGAIDTVARSEAAAVEGAQVVILATHYSRVESIYHQIGPALAPGTVVLDASPLKRPSITWAKQTLPQAPERAAYLVGITPVINPAALYDANAEVEGARDDLFDNGTIVLSPAADCPGEAIELATEIARILGADMHFMDPDEHDGLIAGMEGLPALLGIGLFWHLTRAEAWGDLRRLSNPNFALAAQHLRFERAGSLWALLHHNRENTARYLTGYIEALTALRDSLETDEDGAELEGALAQLYTAYETWDGERMSNKWEKSDSAQAPGMMAQMGGLILGRRAVEGRREDEDEE